jgi:transglutaminase-like putative cysteine protease
MMFTHVARKRHPGRGRPRVGPAALAGKLALCLLLVACDPHQEVAQDPADPVPNVVTADIQAGIEKHIEDQTSLHGGFFPLSFGDKELRLELVRVHTEYLANLGPRRHFACVDLADVSGDVYDVDFFLSGDPGSMTVTETTVHKLNGQPYYAWKQEPDGTWVRTPVETASQRQLGVVRDRDKFEFLYRVKLPEITDTARMWLPLPASDRFQTVEVESIITPGKRRILKEKEYGNQVLFLELGPADSGERVEMRFRVERLEKAVYAARMPVPQKYIVPEIPEEDVGPFRKIGENVVKGKKGDLMRARALYDHVIDRMRYIKHGSGWGKGDAVYACHSGTGNCSDFHSYFIVLARSLGIPARFAIGASIPSERDEGAIDGYHCWAEFLADGKWWPVDISEGDKYTALATYYFGHHPANRFELSRGRDLLVEPGPASGPMNFLAYPVLEIGGQPVKADVQFSFTRNPSVG